MNRRLWEVKGPNATAFHQCGGLNPDGSLAASTSDTVTFSTRMRMRHTPPFLGSGSHGLPNRPLSIRAWPMAAPKSFSRSRMISSSVLLVCSSKIGH
jgi:hypothetical protein